MTAETQNIDIGNAEATIDRLQESLRLLQLLLREPVEHPNSGLEQ